MAAVASRECTQPIRVLMVCPELPTQDKPGSMAPAMRQFRSLADIGVDVQCLDMRGPSVVKYFLKIPELYRRVRGVDIVHAHYGYCGLLAATQLQRPVVLSFMGSDINGFLTEPQRMPIRAWLESRLNRWITSRLAAVVIVKSEQMARLIPRSDVLVIRNGVDINVFRPIDRLEARKRLGWKKSSTYVLFPANPDNPNKGYGLAVQATKEAARVWGRSIELMPLWGYQPDEVPLLMNAADVVLMTSYREGSPNVIKEAMACDAAIVSTPVGDVPELLGGVSGARVCSFDAVALGHAVAELLRRPEPAGGRQRLIAMGLTLEQVARRLVDVYRSVISRK